MEFNSLKLEAQGVLGELFKEKVMPFRLTAAKIDSVGGAEYIVRFHDSRLHSVDVSWSAGESFKDRFRAAMLDRVSRMSGPCESKPRGQLRPHWSLREAGKWNTQRPPQNREEIPHEKQRSG